MKSVIPGGGYALTAGATIAKLAIKKKIGRADTVRLNRVLVRYLMGEPAAPPVGAEQLNFEKARATVASHWGTYLSQFAEIEEIEREKLPPFPAPAAPTELVSEVDTETDWDAIPTRGRR